MDDRRETRGEGSTCRATRRWPPAAGAASRAGGVVAGALLLLAAGSSPGIPAERAVPPAERAAHGARGDVARAADRGVVVPEVPALWSRPTAVAAAVTVDYATSECADAWLRHPILGDPSFDALERLPGNPIVRGEAPFLWPVNVFLLLEPATGRRYAYVGTYLAGYDIGPGKPPAHCAIWRSDDGGGSWRRVGPVFDDPEFRFAPGERPASIAPDATVVIADGRCHMAYDWATDDTTWASASAPRDGADSGVAHAWADSPEGPFHRSPRPILRTSELQRWFPPGGKYCRAYASSLVRRSRDWLVLADVDSGPHFAWGQVALTAVDPEGPWSDPVLVTSLEGDRYFPSPVESFPAFVHDGFVYDPKTSVGANRGFQAIHRARIEEAHLPGAWELHAHGSLWHSEGGADEGFGIWGQTFSGAVDGAGVLHALFPSRSAPDGVGTIHAASRPWARPLRDRGFVLSAHSGPALTLVRAAYGAFALEARLEVSGTSARIAWGSAARLGLVGRADGRPDPVTRRGQQAVELSPAGWRVVETGDAGDERAIATGALAPARARAVRVEVDADGAVEVRLDGEPAWAGRLAPRRGTIGLFLEPWTRASVERFRVTGAPEPAVLTWLASEALSGAGANEADWRRVESPAFRFGPGAVSRKPLARVKWNFRGRGFRLWLPRGPEYGRALAVLDGEAAAEIDLRAPAEEPSRVVLAREEIEDGFHALVIRAASGLLPVDGLETLH